jgi:hypothetical protein
VQYATMAYAHLLLILPAGGSTQCERYPLTLRHRHARGGSRVPVKQRMCQRTCEFAICIEAQPHFQAIYGTFFAIYLWGISITRYLECPCRGGRASLGRKDHTMVCPHRRMDGMLCSRFQNEMGVVYWRRAAPDTAFAVCASAACGGLCMPGATGYCL